MKFIKSIVTVCIVIIFIRKTLGNEGCSSEKTKPYPRQPTFGRTKFVHLTCKNVHGASAAAEVREYLNRQDTVHFHLKQFYDDINIQAKCSSLSSDHLFNLHLRKSIFLNENYPFVGWMLMLPFN